VLAGFEEAAGAGAAAAGAGLGAGAGAALGAGAGEGVAAAAGAGAAAGALEAGAEVSAAAVFLDLEDFLEVVEAVESLAAGAAAVVSAVAVFLLFLDLLVVADASADVALPAASDEAVDFFDLEDLVVEEVEASVAGVEESAVLAFLLFDDLLVEEVSVDEASALVALFFFFLDLVVVLVSLWSVEGDGVWDDGVAWAAKAGRRVTLPATSKEAPNRARYKCLKFRVMMRKFLSLAAALLLH